MRLTDKDWEPPPFGALATGHSQHAATRLSDGEVKDADYERKKKALISAERQFQLSRGLALHMHRQKS